MPTNPVEITQHIVVPEPHDTVSSIFDPPRPPCITFPFDRLAVLRAVQFDRKAMIMAYEVYDERAERNLAAELQAIQTFGTNDRPQDSFGIGLIRA